MKHDDMLWKGIIEDMPAHFLRFFFPEAVDLIDLNREFVFLDKELEQLFPADEGEHPRFVDKLIKVFTKQGDEEWILIHVEVQGYYEKDFGKRMFTYFYRLLDRYDKPVTALAIFTDNNPAFRPQQYNYSFLGTSAVYTFHTYKILDQQEKQLEENENPFALVVLTVLKALQNRKTDDNHLLNLKIDLFRKLHSRPMDKKTKQGLATFLKMYVHFASPETNTIFETTIQSITENKTTMGIEELVLSRAEKQGVKKGIEIGLEKGIEQTKIKTVENLILKLGLSDEQLAEIAEVSVEFVAAIRSKMNAD